MSAEQKLHAGINIGHADPAAHREAEPVMFGFWIFLMSDLVLFALLLATYAAMSVHGIAGGPTPREITDLLSAGIETALLLLSSFTFGLATLALKYSSDRRRLLLWLGATALLGIGFLALEMRDFASLVAEGALPQRSGFLSAHFTLLGCHALHVAAGLLWMALLVVQLATRNMDLGLRLRFMRLALFWHMLDIVWVAIVTFVFLYGAIG